MIDFSNVQSLDGGTIGSGSHINQFMIRSNGNIDFQNLSSITQRNQFDIDIPFYELPSLETADGLTVDLAVGTTFDTGNLLTVSGGQSSSFNIPIFSVWNAPNLETLDDTNLTIGVGGALNASNLQRFRNSSITLQPGVGFNVGSLIDVDNSRFKVEGGSVLGINATSYGYNRNTTSTLFHADGVGSQIIADSLTTISHTAGNFGANYSANYIAENGGMIDFSNVQSLDGGTIGSGSHINLFMIQNGGAIQFGDVVTSQRNRFSIDGSGSEVSFKGLAMNNQSTMSITNQGTLALSGSLSHQHTSEANLNIDNGRVRFSNTALAELEVAGEDLGMSTNGLGNFGFQQLQVGDGLTGTTLLLADNFDNGNRNGGSEVQYLLDVNGQGLVLGNESVIVLNGLDLFVSNGSNSFVSARSLIAPGEFSVAYGNGAIALTGEVGNIINGDFETEDIKGFKTIGEGMAEVVTPLDLDNSLLQLTAGSPIEISQFVSTPDDLFLIGFDAFTEDASGTLSLLLDGNLLESWEYSELTGSELQRFSFLVDDASLWGAINVSLALRWDANTGDSVLIDNWRMSGVAVPEPGSCLLLILLTVAATGRRVRT